ncbi:MAG TPA: hypothetical protein VNK04_09115 [Gemmataceae bacterium]|nr:hypothetical protein [Gemmataceae bacterium]
MSTNHRRIIIPDTRHYPENRSKVPPEEMLKYAGEHVAWSPDGTRILAHGRDQDQVIAELEAAGVHFSEVVWEHVPPLDAEDSLL